MLEKLPYVKTTDASLRNVERVATASGSKIGAAGPIGKREKGRVRGFLIFVAIVMAIFSRPLVSLAMYAADSELNSYILLIPFISAYLLFLRRGRLGAKLETSAVWALVAAAAGLAALAIDWHWRQGLSRNDSLSLLALAFLCSIAAGSFLFLGRRWMAAAAFPMGFLFFIVPLPDAAVDCLETASKMASAAVAAGFFDMFGVPALHDGVIFQLPDINIQVAQECSGIHSSLILMIASLVASHLLLRSFWRRAVLVGFALCLGVVRNGFRVFVLGWLCVHLGPGMIESPIHHRGGPVFFALSLIPFLLLVWVLCRGDWKIETLPGR